MNKAPQNIKTSSVSTKTPKSAQSSTSPAKTDSSSSAANSSAASSTAPSNASSAPPQYTGNYFDDAAFMGDSLTVDFQNVSSVGKATVIGAIGVSAYRAVTDHNVAFNGIKSDTGWMPDRAAAANPKKIYLMFGTNDLCWGSQMTEKFFISNYSKLIDLLKSRCPNAQIYVQSILPITAAVENSKEYPFDNARIDSFNSALSGMCSQKGIKYLNVASVIKGADGKLPAKNSDDGLHLKQIEYKYWVQYLLANK